MPEIPHIIKYMGSKRNILEFVTNTINDFHKNDQRVYDLFGGSAVVSGALRNKMPVTCNDIQKYTSVIAGLYLNNYDWSTYPENILEILVQKADQFVDEFKSHYSNFNFDYSKKYSLVEAKILEKQQQKLINFNFNGFDHLFVKNFSGTYWSYEQCLWIDSISKIARSKEYENTFLYNIILGSLMFAMAYTSQSTGHYAQYRDLTESNLEEIFSYRKKSILSLFKQKFNELKTEFNGNNNSHFHHHFTNYGFLESLEHSEENSLIYADPPYQFVHYSRFYHALETLVRYDYPELQHKGRYRTDRHQSPFCIKTLVRKAFYEMFKKIKKKKSTLILSYSETGMITKDQLLQIAKDTFSIDYKIEIRDLDHIHSTMGRMKDKSRDVKEVLIICSPA